MKKELLFILCLFALVCLAACGKNNLKKESKDITVSGGEKEVKFVIQVGEEKRIATFEKNSSAEGLIEKLKEGPITIDMSDYGNFEKVGALGFDLPRNDKQITTKPGDVILYQGNQLTIYYGTNSWNFTKIAVIDDADQKDLVKFLGDGDVRITLSME